MKMKAIITSSFLVMTGLLSNQVTAATEAPTNSTKEKATAKKG